MTYDSHYLQYVHRISFFIFYGMIQKNIGFFEKSPYISSDYIYQSVSFLYLFYKNHHKIDSIFTYHQCFCFFGLIFSPWDSPPRGTCQVSGNVWPGLAHPCALGVAICPGRFTLQIMGIYRWADLCELSW